MCMQKTIFFISLLALAACDQEKTNASIQNDSIDSTSEETTGGIDAAIYYDKIGAIKTPAGFTRITASDDSFNGWLRTILLKKDKTVYLYNGERKRNQAAQFAVIDIPT